MPLPPEAYLYADFREEPLPELHDGIQGAAGLRVLRSLWKICIRHLTTMVRITDISALYILGEIGTDMSVWKDDTALSCWAGLSPANNASAGKKSTRTLPFFCGYSFPYTNSLTAASHPMFRMPLIPLSDKIRSLERLLLGQTICFFSKRDTFYQK